MKYWARDAIYCLAMACALPWLVLRYIRTGRYRSGLCQKLLGTRASDLVVRTQDARQTVWLHGVSVGEIQLLVPLLKQLQLQSPDARFVLSTTTDSGMELARKLAPGIDLIYFPFDFSWAVRRTIDALRPSILILGELELWPNLVDVLHARNIPVVVVNGRLSENSFRGYRRLRFFTQPMFAKLAWVAAQSESYAERFRACGCPAKIVAVAGSLKFDNASFDRDAPEVQQLRASAGIADSDRVVVVGSTQAPEEQAALDAFASVKQRFPSCKLVVVPRHPDRFAEVHAILSRSELRYARRTELEQNQDAWDILLVDTIGELRWWWGLAEVAIVGGSFGKRGGQNMLEPSAYGVNVAFGPNTKNFRDIVELLLAANAAERIDGLAGIEPWIEQQIASPDSGRQRGLRAREVVLKHQGALQRTLQMLVPFVQAADPKQRQQAA